MADGCSRLRTEAITDYQSPTMKTENLLMVADSERDANALYATGMFVPDAFIYLRLRGRQYLIMSDLEIDRARQQAPHCHVLSLSGYQKKLRDQGLRRPSQAQIISSFLRKKNIRRVVVPANFPLGLAAELGRLRLKVKPKRGNFFPAREVKSPAEVKKISAALRITEAGMAAGIEALRSAKIDKARRLIYRNAPLTSDRLRAVINTAIVQLNGVASHTIVAGGQQACDPHELGYGPLRAHEPIILDIFPRSQQTGYFGDLTRTVVRGRASEAVRSLYAAVLEGQRLAFSKMRPGVPTAEVHRTVEVFFQGQGYETGKHNGRMQGFFHGTGHGLGLELHEPPRTGPKSSGKLRAGHVVTVEPGLYYPEVGGVRLEDVALVTEGAPRNLTRCDKVLEL